MQTELNHPLRIVKNGRKEHTSESKQAIRKYFLLILFLIIIVFFLFLENLHTMLTNRGYARNHLGSYFVA